MTLIEIKNKLIKNYKEECEDILSFIDEADQLNMKIRISELKNGNIKLTASKSIEVDKKYLVGIIGEQMITKKDLTEALEPILAAIKANGDAIREIRSDITEIRRDINNIVEKNNLKR